MVERLESLFYPQVRHQLARRDESTMSDLEAWLPRDQLDLRTPHGADQPKPFFRAPQAHSAAEAEEPCVTDDRACLLEDLSTERLFPGLVTFRTAARPPPSLTIVADQDDLIIDRDTEGVRSMGLALRSCDGRVPRDEPIATLSSETEILHLQQLEAAVSSRCLHTLRGPTSSR
jgi:hypothetical protein